MMAAPTIDAALEEVRGAEEPKHRDRDVAAAVRAHLEKVRAHLTELQPDAAELLGQLEDERLLEALADFGGHDLLQVLEAMEHARQSDKPTMILAHTLKGWGLQNAATPGNHSTLPENCSKLAVSFIVSGGRVQLNDLEVWSLFQGVESSQ